MDGTDKVVSLQSRIGNTKRDRNLTKEEKDSAIAGYQKELEAAKAVEAKNKDEISKLISDAVNYLKGHYDSEYYQKVAVSCEQEKIAAKEKYARKVAELEKEHSAAAAKLTDRHEIKDEKYVTKTACLTRSWISRKISGDQGQKA